MVITMTLWQQIEQAAVNDLFGTAIAILRYIGNSILEENEKCIGRGWGMER